jgi:hypothetical protein
MLLAQTCMCCKLLALCQTSRLYAAAPATCWVPTCLSCLRVLAALRCCGPRQTPATALSHRWCGSAHRLPAAYNIQQSTVSAPASGLCLSIARGSSNPHVCMYTDMTLQQTRHGNMLACKRHLLLSSAHLCDHDIVQHLDGTWPAAHVWCVVPMAQLTIFVRTPGNDILGGDAYRVLQAACHTPARRKASEAWSATHEAREAVPSAVLICKLSGVLTAVQYACTKNMCCLSGIYFPDKPVYGCMQLMLRVQLKSSCRCHGYCLRFM